MAEVKILFEGFTTAESSSDEATSCTIGLVKDGKIKMVVDPGTVKNQKVIVNALRKEGLRTKDVNFVCITHSHMDHYRNIGMFAYAKSLDFWGIWEGDKVKDWDSQFSRNIKIIKTPGHNYDGITLIVDTHKGKVAVCGDVFWKENYPENDPYASDDNLLKESRKKVSELADWIVPGHAGIYRIKK
jgi:glyoxylase-like metal-dependent hydrolase (beta-lactamase superfamily II)